MIPNSRIVYLLDDDPGMIRALSLLLKEEGFEVQGFTSSSAFLDAYQPHPVSCLVLDVAMPDINGLRFQERLTHAGILIPIIFLTGHGDLPMGVQAMKHGAVDFLTKPVTDDVLLGAVEAALAIAADRHDTSLFILRVSSLTTREKQILNLLLEGQLNKQIAVAVGTGEPNIKYHRSNIMRKLHVQSLAELARSAERAGLRLLPKPASGSGLD